MRAREFTRAPAVVTSATRRTTPSWFGRSSQTSSPGRMTWKPIATIFAHDYGLVMLVVAATQPELDFVTGVETLCCGIGPVEAALATARRLSESRPRAIVH